LRGGEVEDVNIAVVVEVEAGPGQFGVLLVGAEGDSGFAVDPLGSGGVGDDVGGLAVGGGEVAIVVDEVAEVVGEEVAGEGFPALAGGQGKRKAGSVGVVGDADGMGVSAEVILLRSH